MIFASFLLITAGFAFYKWLNRDNGHQNDGGDNEAVESHEAKVARYNRCGMSEVSDPDFWMELWHFDEDPLVHDEVDMGDQMGFGRHNPNLEDWHMNHEIALLMVM